MKKIKQIKREARHLFRLCRSNGSLDEDRVLRVVQSVLGSKRRGHLALANEFERLVRLEELQHAAKVESAVTLSPDLQANVRANLAHMYGPGIRTSFTETPELIGGMRISVGSDVYDGSVQGRLERLQESF